MLRKAVLFAALVMAVSLAGACSTGKGETVVHQSNLAALVESAGFAFALPVQLPADFLQTDLALVNSRTVRIQYDDGQRQLCLWAAPKAADDDVTILAQGLGHQTLLEINGHAVAFYTQQGDINGPGHALWDQDGISYCLTGATPQEAAGMLYSMQDAQTLTADNQLGRPRQGYESPEALAEALGFSFPQPATIADDYRFDSCYAVAGRIAVAEYENGAGTLTYQVSPEELVHYPYQGDRQETKRLFEGTPYELSVTLVYLQGDSFRREAQWQWDGLYYRLTCSTDTTGAQLLTLVREFAAWMETASKEAVS